MNPGNVRPCEISAAGRLRYVEDAAWRSAPFRSGSCDCGDPRNRIELQPPGDLLRQRSRTVFPGFVRWAGSPKVAIEDRIDHPTDTVARLRLSSELHERQERILQARRRNQSCLECFRADTQCAGGRRCRSTVSYT